MKWCNKNDKNNSIPIIDYYYIDNKYIDKFSMSNRDVKEFKKRIIKNSNSIKNIDLSSCNFRIISEYKLKNKLPTTKS